MPMSCRSYVLALHLAALLPLSAAAVTGARAELPVGAAAPTRTTLSAENTPERLAPTLTQRELRVPQRQSRRASARAARRAAHAEKVGVVKPDGGAIAGFVLSLVGLFFAGIPLGILGVVFGAVALGRIRRSEGRRRGKGFAIAAIILGIVAIVGAAIMIGGGAT